MTVLKDIQKECCIQTQNDSGQPLWAPKKFPPKMIKRKSFSQFSNLQINKTHFSQNKYYSVILAVPPQAPSEIDVPKFLLDEILKNALCLMY